MPSRICAYCHRHAEMHGISPPHETDAGRVAGAFRCGYCKEISVAVYTGSRVGGDWAQAMHQADEFLDWLPEIIRGQEYSDVPQVIASAADEAHRCLSIASVRGALMLGRAVIEATAKDKGINSGSLFDKIDALGETGHVREHTRGAAHEIRAFGNDMAHGDFDPPVSKSDAGEVLALMDEVLDEVYEGPARVARLKARRSGGDDSS